MLKTIDYWVSCLPGFSHKTAPPPIKPLRKSSKKSTEPRVLINWVMEMTR